MLAAGLVAALLLTTDVPVVGHAQLDGYDEFMAQLRSVCALEDPVRREELVSSLWKALGEAGRIPYVDGERVAFLDRGEADSLCFVGDFNGWRIETRDAERIASSSVWIQEEQFPLDARLDYKIVRNQGQWLLDPENPAIQVGGFGPNSELFMPEYVPSRWVERREDVPRGSLSASQMLESEALGPAVPFRVDVPADYAQLQDLPSIYVTDGHEYADDDMGSMVIVLDNLIADRAIVPILAVFIDPRVGGRNARAEQYRMNARFARFVATELVPYVDRGYRSATNHGERAILGTSLGGLNSAYFAVEIPQTFGLIAIQSPAFQAASGTIIPRLREARLEDQKIHMSWGSFFDFGEGTKQVEAILRQKACTLRTLTASEGHSWGQWRAQLDDILVYFWGP